MRAFIYLAAAAYAGLTAASSTANAFNNPPGGYSFTAGQATTLKWTPSTSGTVSLRLQSDEVSTLMSGTAIASDVDNSGSYTWNVPTDLVANQEYTIEIIDDNDASNYNFLPRFTVTGATASASSNVASSTSSAESTTSTASTSTSSASTTTSTSTSTSSTGTTSTPTTLTTATRTSSSSSSTASTTSSASSSSSSSSSATASQTAVPTSNAGMINRVSGGMLAVVAGAIALV
ncbi:uncharacterized protein N7459_006798 [Penicillium hispanicum]|uniref:uncharacterized protein n=1 Tax=Penicillium hispanicum TaxID=1080232 RepID=UPI002540EB15|nr:uncharacterized protein N7459_006798 [Penicillium hispanicum]KAJ5577834.1 hypothetical protein N7459_006798 [Penicillium hispanicum]